MTSSTAIVPLVYNGEVITQRDEMISLTDMWRAAGADPQQAPAKWRALPATKAFVEAVSVTIGFSDSELFKVKNGGRDPGTSAHWQVGLAYAKYLSPEFHIWCNTVVRERMEGHRTGAVTPEVLEQIERSYGIVRSSIHKITEMEKVVNTLPALIETVNRLVGIVQPSTPGVIIRHGKTAGGVLKAMGFIQCPKGLAVRVGNWLERAGCRVEGRVDTGVSRARMFDPDKAEEWFKAGGAAAVERTIAERRGQGTLALNGQIVRKMPDDIPDGVGAIRVEGELIYFNAADCNLGPGDVAVVVTHSGKIMIDTPTPCRIDNREWMSSRRLEKMPGFPKPVMTQWECTYIGKVIGRGNVVPIRPTIAAH